MDDTTDKTTCRTVDPWQPIPTATNLPLALPKLDQSDFFQPSLESNNYLSLIGMYSSAYNLFKSNTLILQVLYCLRKV